MPLYYLMVGIKQIWIRVTSVAMLLLFIGLIVNNVLCNFAHAIDATGQEHGHPYGHDHHHEGENPTAKHDHKDKGHDHKSDSDTGCCNDYTFTVFTRLQRDYAPASLNTQVAFVVVLLSNNINSASIRLSHGVCGYIEPPPKIPIRVFIQSFQV